MVVKRVDVTIPQGALVKFMTHSIASGSFVLFGGSFERLGMLDRVARLED